MGHGELRGDIGGGQKVVNSSSGSTQQQVQHNITTTGTGQP